MFAQVQSKTQAAGATLVAVSKTQSPEKILEIYKQGQRVFGENRVQELLSKVDLLPKDIEWHLIGHLQTNKVKFIAPFVRLIHSVDSLKLLSEIDKEAKKCGRVIDCLLQFHVAQEETKFGLDENEALELLQSPDFQTFTNVRICGVMGMASFSEDQNQVRREFQHLRQIFQNLKSKFFSQRDANGTGGDFFKEISMGMSSDFEIALSEGSTMVRVGSLVFN